MSNMPGDIKSLCEDITTGHADRGRSIKNLREQAETIRDNARKFVNDSRRIHKETAKDLRKGLAEKREELIKNVALLREDFRRKEREIRSDLTEASKIWSSMNAALKNKRSK